MAGNDNSGEKTEQATPKKLRDARNKGDVAKSRDITSTLGLVFTFGLLWALYDFMTTQSSSLLQQALKSPGQDFSESLSLIGGHALDLFLTISAALLVPILAFGMLVEFLQIGPILTFDKMKPKMSNLDPMSGIKRMFDMDNLVEVVKAIVKTCILFFIGWITISALLSDLMILPTAEPASMLGAIEKLILYLMSWTIGIFLLLTALDASYQKYSFAKKQKMSLRDIKQEFKDTEGDPMIKGQRQQTAHEWAQEGASQAARNASVLLVNPTHVAIAIDYDRELIPVPIIAAMGEDDTAHAMRTAAEQQNVPVLRNKKLARTLLADAHEGDPVPRDLFDIMAEIILWSSKVRERIAFEKENTFLTWDGEIQLPPGEDLTHYPSVQSPLGPNPYEVETLDIGAHAKP